jgi:hypothetical protein
MLDSFIRDSSERQLCICNLDAAPQIDIAAIDLAFVPRHSPFWLNRLPQGLSENTLDFLSHRVSNNPKDLLAHVQRVAAHYQVGTAESLYGALLDLFISLESKGYALRKRLFMKCAPFFGNEQRKALVKGLEAGIKATDRVPLTVTSLLKYPNSGNMRLVERLDGHVAIKNFDALDEARDLIDSGFMDEARMLLEELLLTRPECAETNKELLDLYRYTKNKKAFFATKQRLEGLPLALAETWEELAKKFINMEERVGNE